MAKAIKKKAASNKSILTTDSLQFLSNYINNPSPVGFESAGQLLWLEYIKPYVDETFTDPYGTAVGVINPGQKFKVVLEAHADEISWFVNYINAEGLMYLKRNGGVDHQIAPGQRVIIHGKKGTVKAVFGWPAIHTRIGTADKEPVAKVENLFLDCGARSKKEVDDLGIHVGCVVTYTDGFEELSYDYFIGRAMDNRIGGFMIAEVARLLTQNKKTLPYSLYVVNAVQEEIGLRGAEMIARRIKPDAAIITDVTHDTSTPMINKFVEGEKIYSLPAKELIHYGYPLLETLRKKVQANKIQLQKILVAPSWYKKGILNTCILPLVEALGKTNHEIWIRPHPEFIKRNKKQYEQLTKLSAKSGKIFFDTGSYVFTHLKDAAHLITDRSGIAFEYAFATGRPVLFIDTALKIQNSELEKFTLSPLENIYRGEIGMCLQQDEVSLAEKALSELKQSLESWESFIRKTEKDIVFSSACWSNGIEYIRNQLTF